MVIISRKDALGKGLLFYFTGKPCNHGHVSKRYCSANRCVDCAKQKADQLKELRRENRKQKTLSPRKMAQQNGDVRYTPNEPCHRCGTSQRLTSNGVCVYCNNKTVSEKYSNDAEFRDKQAAYRKANNEKYNSHTRNRRAKIKGLDGKHSQLDVWELFDKQEGRCPYCDIYLRTWHVDHKTPVSKGGYNGPENLQLTCPTCNLKKHNKTDGEFKAMLKLIPLASSK